MAVLNLRSQSYSFTRTATGTSGQSTITITDTVGVGGISSGQRVTGTGIATNATVSSISGDVVTLSLANTGTVSGSITFADNTVNAPLTNAQIDGNFTELNARLIAMSARQMAITRGGTNTDATPTAGAIAYGTGSAYAFTTAGTAGQILTSGGTGAPAWISTVSIARGGTNGSATPTAGAVSYGTGSAYAFTSAGTSGQILTSGGTGAPTWVTTIPVANGGTNGSAAPVAGAVAYGTGSAYAFTSAGTTGQVLTSNGTGAPTWTTISSGTNVNISNDTSSAATTFYPSLVSNQTSGTASALVVSSTKLYFQPSTGILNATAFNSLSDQRLKYNVTPIANATETVKQLKGTSFNWKDNDTKSYGVIAQELEAVLPELVTGEATKTVNYAGLIAFLIEAVKELDQRVRVLEGR